MQIMFWKKKKKVEIKSDEEIAFDLLVETNDGKGYTEDENLNAVIKFKWHVYRLKSKEFKHLCDLKAFRMVNPTHIPEKIKSYIESSESNLKHYEERIIHYDDYIKIETAKLK